MVRQTRPNPIRAIGDLADKIERDDEVKVIRLHLGNPGTNQEPEISSLMIESVKARTAGYGPHHGALSNRDRLAKVFNDMIGVENYFQGQDVSFAPGATVITAALMTSLLAPGDGVLLSKPGYPPYATQVDLLHGQQIDYVLNADGLLTYDELKQGIDESGGRVKLVVITYPHNPTGKALSDAEARQVADAINRINHEYPEIFFYDDAVYSATTDPEIGHNDFFRYLSDAARMQTIVGLSGAKSVSMAGERAGGLACKNEKLMRALMDSLSALVAGGNVHAEEGFISGMEMMHGQYAPSKYNAESVRHKIGRFYQERRKIIAEAFAEFEDVDATYPAGSMYVYVRFAPFMKGKRVPEPVRDVVGSDTFETDAQVVKYFLSLHKLGLTPIATVPGEAFNDDPAAMAIRISAVSRDLDIIKEAVKSFQSALQGLNK